MSRKGRRIGPQETFQVYLALGAGRSLQGVRARYQADADAIPQSLPTLKRWSAREDWPARAREHDRQVAERAHEIAVAESAQAQWGAARGVLAVAQRVHDRLLEVIPKSGESVSELSKAMIELVKTAEVLQGGFSDRAAVSVSEDGERRDPDEFLRRMDEVLKKNNGPTRH